MSCRFGARSPNSRRPTRTSPAEARISRDLQGRRKIKSLAFVANGWSYSVRKQGYAALALGSSDPKAGREKTSNGHPARDFGYPSYPEASQPENCLDTCQECEVVLVLG